MCFIVQRNKKVKKKLSLFCLTVQKCFLKSLYLTHSHSSVCFDCSSETGCGGTLTDPDSELFKGNQTISCRPYYKYFQNDSTCVKIPVVLMVIIKGSCMKWCININITSLLVSYHHISLWLCTRNAHF